MSDALVPQALALAQGGEPVQAVELLEGAMHDPAAQLLLGLWRIEGQHAPRDISQARAHFRSAAELGNAGGARVLAGLVATGSGGPRDWAEATALLAEWAGRDPLAARQIDLIAAMDIDDHGDPVSGADTNLLSTAPYVAHLPGLLSAAECQFLIDVAQPRFKPAEIFHDAQNRFLLDPVRQSDAAGFPLIAEWPLVHAINRRIAAASATDVTQGETLQILRYGPAQRYRPHLDAIPALANQRILTVIVYLNDDYTGGETRFLKSGLTVKGRTGDALLFRNVLSNGRPDPASEHEGCPISSGTKYLASRWIRAEPPAPGTSFGAHEASGDPAR